MFLYKHSNKGKGKVPPEWLSAEPVILINNAQINLQTYILIHKHTPSHRGRIFPQMIAQVVVTRDQTCNPQMREQALCHAANPTCLNIAVAKIFGGFIELDIGLYLLVDFLP